MKNLYKALADFQREVPVIHKGTQGYSYSYADLPTVFNVINPLLKKHGLAFTQPIDGKSIKTIIFHVESGEKLESSTEIPQNVALKGMNDFQVLGSAITYLRRYALSSILGLVTDKDIDASGEQAKKQPKPTQETTEKPNTIKPTLQVMDKDKSYTAEWSGLLDALQSGKTFTIEQIKKKYLFDSSTQIKLKELLKIA